MDWNKKSKWIWLQEKATPDSYGDFLTIFTYSSGKMVLQLSADSNYTVYINGKFVNSQQYPDYPFYKVYDEIDITSYCNPGINWMAITVWYYGIVGSQTYYKGEAALRYELYQDGKLCAWSDRQTLSRKSKNYISQNKKITSQLGLSFWYDATVPENWRTGEDNDFIQSREIKQELPMFPRPIEKYNIGKPVIPTLVKKTDSYIIYDLGREEVGYLTFRIKSSQKQKVIFAFGEHITDGQVRYEIEGRDFSVAVTVAEGVTEYTNYFRRLGLRYLQVIPQSEIWVDYVSIFPTEYPLNHISRKLQDPTLQKIYDVSVRTLELCMHDHYEDCPWREQALYAMDSRNQIICGYYAFEEYRFPRASLELISKSIRPDGLLTICAPSDLAMTIPSFSLHYFTEILEYTRYSGDKTLAAEVLPVLEKILHAFLSHMEDGLVAKFDGAEYWNFYEWTEGLADIWGNARGVDAALNCLLSRALTTMQEICDILQIPANYTEIAKKLNQRIRETFYQSDTHLFANDSDKKDYSELVNALAVLCGAAQETDLCDLCDALTNGTLAKISLSMRCFKYDALLQTDRKMYGNYVLNDIHKTYQAMLSAGATSFWETEMGEADFNGAGSLCHGWSAMPVYYLSILL